MCAASTYTKQDSQAAERPLNCSRKVGQRAAGMGPVVPKRGGPYGRLPREVGPMVPEGLDGSKQLVLGWCPNERRGSLKWVR